MSKIVLLLCLFILPEFAAASFLNGDDPPILIAPLLPPAPEKDIALVLKTTGQVQINNSSNGAWQNALRGMRLNAGSQVRTGEQSLAAIVFTDDKSLLKVRSNSKVMINGRREEESSSSRRIIKTIAMEFGELWAKVTKSNSPFRIETPSGVAAVKGTVFYGVIDGSGKFHIICLDGAVELINKLGSVLVQAGQTGISSPNTTPESHATTPNELPNWANDGGQGNGEIEIEFENENGEKKKLKIRYQ